MKKRITIKDIAKALNIHHSTVSRALRNDSLVTEETRKMIVNYAKQHGYRVNLTALELRGSSRNKLAIIVPNINHQFFSNVVSYFTNYAYDNGYVVSIFQTNESFAIEKEIIDTIVQYNFSGVIASISMQSSNSEHFNKFLKHNIPLVMFDRVSQDLDVSKVVINNTQVMINAVEELVLRKHNRIVHISGPANYSVFGERQDGYKQASNKFNLQYENLITLKNGFNVEYAKSIIKNIFSQRIIANAIICDSSILTYELIKELFLHDIKIPENMAIITFGSNPMMEIMKPSITSIEQPCKEIAKRIFQLIQNKIDNPDSINETIQLPAKIKIRDSI